MMTLEAFLFQVRLIGLGGCTDFLSKLAAGCTCNFQHGGRVCMAVPFQGCRLTTLHLHNSQLRIKVKSKPRSHLLPLGVLVTPARGLSAR